MLIIVEAVWWIHRSGLHIHSTFVYLKNSIIKSYSIKWAEIKMCSLTPKSIWLCVSCFSCVWLFLTPWTIACPAPLSMGFSRQEYWSGEPCPPNSYECMCILYLMENNFFKNIKIKALQVILTCNQNWEWLGHIIWKIRSQISSRREVRWDVVRWSPGRVARLVWVPHSLQFLLCIYLPKIWASLFTSELLYVYVYIYVCVHDLRQHYQLYSVACNFWKTLFAETLPLT